MPAPARAPSHRIPSKRRAGAFRDKVVLITGASSGIGSELALQLGRTGARLGLLARREDRLVATADSLREHTDSEILLGDVTNEAFCREAIDTLADRFGRIDLIINNAGVTMNAQFADTDPQVIRRLMDVNFFGSLYLTHYGLPLLQVSRGGVVFVSSILGKRGFPGRAGYAASKFALHGLAESIRPELMRAGIYVGIFCPGFVQTEIRENALSGDGGQVQHSAVTHGSVMSAERVAFLFIRAIARRRRELTLTAEGKALLLLNRLFPGLTDRVASAVTD